MFYHNCITNIFYQTILFYLPNFAKKCLLSKEKIVITQILKDIRTYQRFEKSVLEDDVQVTDAFRDTMVLI